MITVEKKWDLKTQTASFVRVRSEDKVYARIGGEYIQKAYFEFNEILKITGKNATEIYWVCRKLGIQARANRGKKIRVTLKQLREIIKQVEKIYAN